MCGVAAALLAPNAASAADFYLYGAASKVFAEADSETFAASTFEDAYGGALGFRLGLCRWNRYRSYGRRRRGAIGGTGNDVTQASLSFNVYYAPKLGMIQPRVGGALALLLSTSRTHFPIQKPTGWPKVWAAFIFGLMITSRSARHTDTDTQRRRSTA